MTDIAAARRADCKSSNDLPRWTYMLSVPVFRGARVLEYPPRTRPMECSHVLPRLYVGSCPENLEDIARLRREYRVTAVLTFQTDADRRLYNISWDLLRECYRQWDIAVRQVPIQDKSEDDLTRKLPESVEALGQLLDQGHTVFAHCNIGNGRSPTVVAAWLYWTQGRDLEAAAAEVRQCRECQPNLNVIRSARLKKPSRASGPRPENPRTVAGA